MLKTHQPNKKLNPARTGDRSPRRVYLDFSATTPMLPEVRKAMEQFEARGFGNASSVHSYGREARVALENARTEIGKTINAAPAEIIFTSGGTESINTAIKGLAEKAGKGKNQIVTTKAEHQAVLETCAYLEKHGFEIRYANIDEFGKTSPEALMEVMTDQTALVAIMHANNEVATVNDLASLSEVAHKHGALFFTDAVQSYGKFPIGVKELGIDAMAFCAHKIYGPKGIGALYIKGGLVMEPLIHGGSQERNRRGGTESTGLAVGFQTAARAMQKSAKDIL
ncbi:MAG TPA: cysteine desulfurase family protein, partial [Candidatus Kapabacteria bacterium]|nr:cysteine desulfurase family protein [Candidatus Kapabacteria bacterium]